mmetsp:Transcript_25994/g.43369  ORF Transcript_25994/g.43369 Transcript_25994/m.43369 type:complete len:86 (-) Transcript_25994:1-258(-)
MLQFNCKNNKNNGGSRDLILKMGNAQPNQATYSAKQEGNPWIRRLLVVYIIGGKGELIVGITGTFKPTGCYFLSGGHDEGLLFLR